MSCPTAKLPRDALPAWKGVLCSQASVTKTGLDLSRVKGRELLHAVRTVQNLQAARSLNTPACFGTRLSRGGASMPFCIVPSFHPCKVRPSQDPQAIPSSEREGGKGGDRGKHMPGHAEVA